MMPQPQASNLIGTNLAGISYYSSELPFCDAFPTASGWIAQTDEKWSTGEESKVEIDQYGWLKALPTPGRERGRAYTKISTLMYRELKGLYPDGDYVVLYEGKGTLTYGFDAQLKSSGSGRDVISVDSSKGGGILLTITATDPSDYIRNIHVVQTKYEATFRSAPFNPDFLRVLKPFGILRFMEWMGTNGSIQGDWSDRPTSKTAFCNPEFSSSTTKQRGVPLELMVQLANQTHSAPWFNMPHMATDDYITQFAQQVKADLLPNLSVYVEYSNEFWNTQFAQGQWIEQQGLAQWPTANPFTARCNRYGERSAQISDIWHKIFSDRPGRIKYIMGGQAASTGVVRQALECSLSDWHPCLKHSIYGIGIAPYFGGEWGSPALAPQIQVQNWTVDKLIKALIAVSLPEVQGWIKAHADLATQYGLNLVAYEGGQSLVGTQGEENNELLVRLFIAANRDSRMYGLYLAMLLYWRSMANAEAFVHFNDVQTPGKWGSWGALESVNQPSSPKFQALTDVSQGV